MEVIFTKSLCFVPELLQVMGYGDFTLRNTGGKKTYPVGMWVTGGKN